mgnify:CR=1 FL=1
MVYRTALLLPLLLLLIAVPLLSQDAGSSGATSEQIRQYEERLRDMVNRFEETRELLRQQIDQNETLQRENAELRQQLETVREERNELEGMSADERVASLESQLRRAEQLNDALIRKLKGSIEQNTRLQERLKKSRSEREAVRDDFLDLVELREEQKLFQIGTGFSPQGYINGIALLNIPEAPLGLFVESNYRFREKKWAYAVGVQLRFGRWSQLLSLFGPEAP